MSSPREYRPIFLIAASGNTNTPKTADELESPFGANNLYLQIMDDNASFDGELKESDSLDARKPKDSGHIKRLPMSPGN